MILSGKENGRSKDQHMNNHIRRNFLILWLAAYHLLSPYLALELAAGNGI